MPIEELYRSVRQQVRRLAYRDTLYVIWAYTQWLQQPEFEIPADIEVDRRYREAAMPQGMIAEWRFEQIAREAIRYAGEVADRAHSVRQWGTLASIANALRDLEDEIYATLVPEGSIHLEIMRISHRQFVWQQQRPTAKWIIRYYKLFNTEAINPICLDATGLTVDKIYFIGMAFLGHFLRSFRTVEQMNIELPGVTREQMDQFIALTSCSLPELSNKLRDEHALNETFAYRYSSLREFPMVRTQFGGVRELLCPVPTLLFWRFTTGLYYSLKDVAGFPTAIGRSFHSYVASVLEVRITDPALRVLPETEYHVGRLRKDSVDLILVDGDHAGLFIECKTMRLTWASKAGMSDLTALERDIRKLAGAIVQVYRQIKDYRAGRYPHLAFVEARRIYPAIVTLEDWYFFGHDLPRRVEAAVRQLFVAAELPTEWLEEMPYSVISIDEFETAAGVLNSAGVGRVMADKTGDPERRRWSFTPYCTDRFPDAVAALPRLFLDEYDAMFADILQAA